MVLVTRPEWSETWLSVAETMAKRSLCTRRQVGAVIVKGNYLVSVGYNCTPPKQAECFSGGCPRGGLTGPLPEDYSAYECWALHAEANALLRAGERSQGASLYCTHRPCPQCQNLIMGAGLEFVFWPEKVDGGELLYWSPGVAAWYPSGGRMT